MRKILLILTVLLVVGCGARKVNKSQVEVKQETTSTTKDTISQVSEKNETLVDTTIQVIRCYEPIDSTKEMIIDGHKYQNVRFKTSSIKNGITSSKKEESILNGSKITNEETITKIQEGTKYVDREPRFNWWWLLIVIVIGLIYYEYNKK